MKTLPLIAVSLLLLPFWIALYMAFRLGSFVLSTVLRIAK